MSQRFLIILPLADRERANGVAKANFDPDGGEKTFSIGLSASGSAPATHFWCSALFSGEGAARLAAAQAAFPDAVVCPYNADTDPSFPKRKITELGLNQIVTIQPRP
jgi:hypothetical protein